MDEFLLLIYSTHQTEPGLLLLQQQRQWQEWVDCLTATGSLGGLPLQVEETGRLLQQDHPVAEGSYREGKEAISGALLIRAADYEAAIRIAQGCPVLAAGGTVEVRQAL